MFKKKFYKLFSLITVLSLLTACQRDLTPNPDITVPEESKAFETSEITDSDDNEGYGNEYYFNTEQDWNLKTDKALVPVEELYDIEKKNIDPDVFKKYGTLNRIEGNRCFFSKAAEGKVYYEYMKEEPVEKASVTVYDSDNGEYSVLLSETPKDDEYGLSFYVIAVYDSYMYYFRTDFKPFYELNEELSLWRVSLKDKAAEKLFTLESKGYIKEPVRLDNFLYFYESCEAELSSDGAIWVIYQCDMDTGKTSVFRYNAERPLVYKNGIIYYHNGGFYYHGDSSEVTGKGILYKDDELIFYPNPEGSKNISGINSKNDAIIYTYDIYIDNYAIGSVFGFFDENFNRIDICSTPPPSWYITADSCRMSDSGLISVDRRTRPLIYDIQNDSFSEIFIDGYSHYAVYSAEDRLHFLAYETDDGNNYISAALYTVARK